MSQCPDLRSSNDVYRVLQVDDEGGQGIDTFGLIPLRAYLSNLLNAFFGTSKIRYKWKAYQRPFRSIGSGQVFNFLYVNLSDRFRIGKV